MVLEVLPQSPAATGVSCRVVGGHVLVLASRALRRTIIARHRLVDQKGRVPASWAIAQAEDKLLGAFFQVRTQTDSGTWDAISGRGLQLPASICRRRQRGQVLIWKQHLAVVGDMTRSVGEIR
jgi:hypothetical protein